LSNIEKAKFGIEPLDYILPEGILRNSFIVFAGKGGAGKSLLLMGIAKRFLENGEPVIYFALDDDPITIVKQFQLFEVSINEYVKRELFYIIDGYSFRIRGKEERMHISVIEEVDPQNLTQVINICTKILDDQRIMNKGLFIIDSINEFLTLYEVNKAIELIKNLRANISKARGIIVLSSLHTSSQIARNFLSLIEHIVDGIILTEAVVKSFTSSTELIMIRRLRVKRMKGVPHYVNWIPYVIESSYIKIITTVP